MALTLKRLAVRPLGFPFGVLYESSKLLESDKVSSRYVVYLGYSDKMYLATQLGYALLDSKDLGTENKKLFLKLKEKIETSIH